MLLQNNPPRHTHANPVNLNNPEAAQTQVTAKTVESEPAKPQPEVTPTVTESAQIIEPAPVAVEVQAPPTIVVGTSEAMQYIFSHESGGNPQAINATSGACGIGQAWPCSKLLAACGSLDNVDCQIDFFTQYANSRYGGWVQAMYFWQNNSWW